MSGLGGGQAVKEAEEVQQRLQMEKERLHKAKSFLNAQASVSSKRHL